MRLIFAILIIVALFCVADGGLVAEIIGWIAGGIIALLLIVGIVAGALKAIIHLDFVSAYNNNRGIIAVVIIAIIIFVDSIYIIKKLNNES